MRGISGFLATLLAAMGVHRPAPAAAIRIAPPAVAQDPIDYGAKDRAERKRARVRARNLGVPCGAPVWSEARREALSDARWRNRAAQHGHQAGHDCDLCVEIGNGMVRRATA